ncbi:MAG: carboxypeptidase regulatory-like domain-containing protein [Anaerolineae bacterium]
MMSHLLALLQSRWRSYQNGLHRSAKFGRLWFTLNWGRIPTGYTVSPTVTASQKFSFTQITFLTLLIAFSLLVEPAYFNPAHAAQTEPPAALTLQIIGPTSVQVDDTFQIQVVVDTPNPGLFGYQFWLTWNSALVTPVEPTPILNPGFPLIVQNQVGDGQLQVVASRQGEAADLPGSLTLLTWTFRAVAPTPLDTAHFDLSQAVFGQKDGVEIPINGISNLVMTISAPAKQQGSLIGHVQAQGRVPGNQGGYTVRLTELGLTTTTAPNGDFTFSDVPFGLYSLTVSQPGYLSATCTNLNHQQESTILTGLTLLAGDFNGDGQINIADSTTLGLVLGQTNPAADVNSDGQTNVLDLILMGVNFGRTAADQVWMCQP